MTWLDRTLIRGDYLCLCTTEAEFAKELRRMKYLAPWPKWIDDDALATTHYLVSGKGHRASIVCIAPNNMEGIAVATLLVHEAVHVVQEYCRYIGEELPGIEFQAYAIQEVSARLMFAYSDTLLKGDKSGLDLRS
jgi:hypothetical protein